MKYELVAGFETHIELRTESKIFCSCSTGFGSAPNTHCCPVCTGQPGALPVLNMGAVRLAVMAGIATNCKISNLSHMDRKNYSYPDLPKAYQISQFDVPLCRDGYIELRNGKRIRINRIHIEEDAGKLTHSDEEILIDYNRAGVPLIEIVTEPDIRSVEEAKEYVETLRHIMRYIGVSDCRMQEGSMRCDVNISVKKAGDETLGTRTEIKNMNSISNIARAMEYEYSRQCEVIESGAEVVQETLRFDDVKGTTSSMRSKEDAKDYRFFREPDLLAVVITDAEIDEIRRSIPELPHKKAQRYVSELGLSAEDARELLKYRAVSRYFDQVCKDIKNPKNAVRFILGQIFASFSTEKDKELFCTKVSPSQLSELIGLLEQGRINNNLAKLTLEKMMNSGKSATAFLSEEDLRGMSDIELTALCHKAVEQNPTAVEDFKKGKEKALMALLGFVMRESRGKADAKSATDFLRKILS